APPRHLRHPDLRPRQRARDPAHPRPPRRPGDRRPLRARPQPTRGHRRPTRRHEHAAGHLGHPHRPRPPLPPRARRRLLLLPPRPLLPQRRHLVRRGPRFDQRHLRVGPQDRRAHRAQRGHAGPDRTDDHRIAQVTMAISLRYAARSDVGLIRSNNQDSGYAGPNLLVLADGMGGAAGGDIASSVAVAHLAALDGDEHGADDILGLLTDALSAAHTDLTEYARARPELAGLGTTVVAMLVSGRTAAMV